MNHWSRRRWGTLLIVSVVGLSVCLFVIPPVLLWHIYGLAGKTYAVDDNGSNVVSTHDEQMLQLAQVLVHANLVLASIFVLALIVCIIKYAKTKAEHS